MFRALAARDSRSVMVSCQPLQFRKVPSKEVGMDDECQGAKVIMDDESKCQALLSRVWSVIIYCSLSGMKVQWAQEAGQ